MSDEEIMQKLKTSAEIDCCRCWQNGENCDSDDCEKVIAEKALALINRQQAEIERLQKKYDKAMDNLKAVLKERAGEQNA